MWKEAFNRVFWLRLVASLVVGAASTLGIAWTVAFFVSDWAIEKSQAGFQSSVDTLNTTIGNQSAQMIALNTQLHGLTQQLSTSKEAFADEIAKRIAAIQSENGKQEDTSRAQISELVDQLGETNRQLSTLNGNLNVTNTQVTGLRSDFEVARDQQQKFQGLVMTYLLGTNRATPTPATLKTWNLPANYTGISVKAEDLKNLLNAVPFKEPQ